MNSFDKSVTILGSVFIIMFFSCLISISLNDAYVNSPTNFTTSHYMELNTDNNTRESLRHMSQINEDDLECELRLLNLTLQHQKEISVRDMYYLNLSKSK